MNKPIHDDEPDTSEPVVRALLAAECRQWATAPLSYLASSGTTNAMWRVRLGEDTDVVVRLPRRPSAAAFVEQEVAVLRRLAHAELGVSTPVVRHLGSPHEAFPHPWSVLEWIDGNDAWSARHGPSNLANDLASVATAIGGLTNTNVPSRSPGQRGGPLGPLIEALHHWLEHPLAADRLDIGAVERLIDQANELVDEPIEKSFVHGDLIAGNLLVGQGRLRAVIDWGGAGWGDPAQDLAPAWAVLNAEERTTFKHLTGVDEAAWIRGRIFELEHAIGGVLYYEPKGHVLGNIMARTLDRILGDAV